MTYTEVEWTNVFQILAHLGLEDEKDAPYLVDINIDTFDLLSFNNLLSNIIADMSIVSLIINKNIELFVPFCRNNDPRIVMKTIDNIISDLMEIKARGFKPCKFNNECKYKECCAFVHEIDFQLIAKTFKLVQYSSNKLIDKKAHHYASGLFRNLSQLEMHVWHMLSRKSFGKKCVYESFQKSS